MYELEMYILLEHDCLQNKILVVSSICWNFFLFNSDGLLYYDSSGLTKMGIVLAISNVLGIS
jgi:hypothetical protein